MTINSITLRGALVGLAAAVAAPLAAQSAAPEILACYDSRTSSAGMPQGTGIVYRIKVPGVVGQTGCVDPRHTEFSWTIRHGALNGLSADDHPQYLLVAPGQRSLVTDLPASGFKITGLGPATTPGDAVPFEQAVKSGDQASGDLSGSYPNPTVVQLQGTAVSAIPPAPGQVLAFDGAAWGPAPPARGLSGWEVLSFGFDVVAGNTGVLERECPAGKRPTGGGFHFPNSNLISGGDVIVIESSPRVTVSGTTGWRVVANNRSNVTQRMEVWVVCADAQ